MTTRIATSIAHGTPEVAAAKIREELFAQLGGAPPVLVVVFASTEQPLGEVVRHLRPTLGGALLLGASTAGEFTERGDAKGATCAFALAGDYKVFAGMGKNLKAAPAKAVTAALCDLPREVPGYAHRTGILLLDPLAGNGEEVTLLTAFQLGADEPLAGGAAGDDLHMKATHVSCGSEAASDAMVVAQIFSKQPLGIGVCHGHAPLSEPLRVTRASGNVVQELDGRPAWDVWLERTRAHAQSRGVDLAKMTRAEEGAYFLRYEAGVEAGTAFKIRAPLSRSDDGAISFACGVPEGTVLRITESEPERQVASAREAARRARAQLGGARAAGALVFDCICRNLILGAEFSTAVQGMSAELGGAPLAGFETYGEIALDAGDLSGFHNTTSVVLAFPQG
jgi:methyl-accepting chemotaxis protein